MLAYIVRRILLLIPALLAITLVAFLILQLIPGDPARVIVGIDADEKQLEAIRHQLGLDKPIIVQYGIFLKSIVRFNFGQSIRSQDDVINQILPRFKNTLLLALVSITISVIVGVLAGVIASTKQNTSLDYAITSLVLLGISAPTFWIGLLLILFFSVFAGLFPAGGIEGLKSIILPAITLAAPSAAVTARMTRSSMLEVLRMDYIKTARAKGQKESRIVFKHALKNALLPTITIVGIQFGYLMGGSVLVETVFSWPGLGWLIVDAIFAKDYPVVQACVIFFAFSFILVNLVVDILYGYINPRVTYD
ncbi:MAG: ABC transporter permease [Deltaproteobacteria bacterium]|nr:ABC transporter permease [Deltaproteobacteria bacterium]MBW2084941.1 ABC transporter permease [Deltaproteobacteria bacterium]